MNSVSHTSSNKEPHITHK